MLSKLSVTLSNSYAAASQARVLPSTSYVPTRQKRSYEEDEEDANDMDTQPQREANQGTTRTALLSYLSIALSKTLSGDFFSLCFK